MITSLRIQKIFIVINICLFLSINAFAQRQNVYYLKNSGKEVSTKDSADFIRIISEPDSGSVLYKLKELYISGKPKLISTTVSVEPIKLEGQCMTFFPSGKKQEFVNYKKGHKTGEAFEYYPNGKVYQVRQYDDSKKSMYEGVDGGYTITACNDSTGKELVVDGTGYYLGFDSDFKYVWEEGNLKAGLRDGDWKGQQVYKKRKFTFAEKYDNGKLLNGESVDSTGNTIRYAQRETQPGFGGGEQALGQYLSNYIRYPKYAKEHNIQGLVYITFVVEGDGSLTDIKIVRSPGGGLSEEAIRVLGMSPKWIPGKQFGRPVRVQFTVPVNFSLGERF